MMNDNDRLSDRELSAVVQKLWDNDVNRLTPGKDYRISLQVHTNTHLTSTLYCPQRAALRSKYTVLSVKKKNTFVK